MQQGNVYNTTNLMTWIIKIFGIIGMIFIGISLAVPWAGYTIFGTNWGLSLNGWGVTSNIPDVLVGQAGAGLVNDIFYINAMQSGITEGLVAGIFMILVFIFTIITLLIGIKAFRSIGTGVVNKNYLIAGIFAIVTLVLCVIAVTQASTYGNAIYFALTGTALAGGFGYTWGFILMIIALVFFFINYGLDYFILHSGMGLQQPIGGQQQPQVMYTSQQPPPQQPVQQQPVQQTPPPVAPQEQPPQKEAKPSFCNNCGAQLQAGIKFCNQCGTKI